MPDKITQQEMTASARLPQTPSPLDVKRLREIYHTDTARHRRADEDTVKISREAQGLASAQRVAAEALKSLRTRFADQAGSALETGKEKFSEEFEAHEDFSPKGTAELILSGVTSYIFGAFVASRSELTEADLDDFLAQARKGVGQGFEQASQYLDGLELFDGEIKKNAETAIDFVYEGLDSFIERQRELLPERKARTAQ